MSKKISKIFTYLLLTVLAVVGLGNVANSVAEAAGPPTDVIIHKVETETETEAKGMTHEQLKVGIEQGSDAWKKQFGNNAKPLSGVSFTYYKVSESELTALEEANASTPEEVEKYTNAAGVESGDTDNTGQVMLEKVEEGLYWIIENTKGNIASSTAVPFALALPFTDLEGTGYYETIHVYPKNTLENLPLNPKKEVDKDNLAIGETHTWKISQVIPGGIEDYKKFKFTDEIDSRLDWVGSVTVTAADIDLGLGTDYTVVFDDAAEGQTSTLLPDKSLTGILTVEFTEDGLLKLKDETGPIEITFKTKINDTAIMGQEIENNVQVDFDNGHGRTGDKRLDPNDVPSVHTGGKRFVKEDFANKKLLDGAKFKIKNADGEFVIVADDGSVTFGAEAEAKVFTSGAEDSGGAEDTGAFEVRGLPYGEDYVLVETEAPNDYALPTNPETKFNVDADSYEDAAVLKIDNKEITIPQTGGMGTAIFTAIGVVLMTISVVSYKRKSNA